MEGGRLRRDDPPGPVMVTQWWRIQLSPCLFPTKLLGAWLGPKTLGWDFYPPLKPFSIIACHARALHPR